MVRTTPIRVRRAVADALIELGGKNEVKYSEVASFLILYAIMDNEAMVNSLSPETQSALNAEFLNLLGDTFKVMATQAIREGWTFSEMFGKEEKK